MVSEAPGAILRLRSISKLVGYVWLAATEAPVSPVIVNAPVLLLAAVTLAEPSDWFDERLWIVSGTSAFVAPPATELPKTAVYGLVLVPADPALMIAPPTSATANNATPPAKRERDLVRRLALRRSPNPKRRN